MNRALSKGSVAAACLAVSIALVPAAQAETTTSPFDGGGNLAQLVATPGSDTIWAIRTRSDREVPLDGQLVSYDPASGWQRHEIPATAEPRNVTDIAMGSPTNGWAIDETYDFDAGPQRLLHWNGTAWTPVTPAAIAADDRLYEIAASGPDNAWLYGSSNDFEHDYLWHWNGTTWSRADTPQFAGSIGDLVTTGPNAAWMLGDDYSGTEWFVDAYIYHWDGTRWTRWSPKQSHHAGQLAASGSNVWFSFDDDEYYDGRLRHRHGDGWRDVPMPEDYSITYDRYAAGNQGDLWILHEAADQSGRLIHVSESMWQGRRIPNLCGGGRKNWMQDLTVNASGDVYVVGQCSNDNQRQTLAMRWDGQTWTRI